MLYEFQLIGGTEIIELNFPMAEAPEIGAQIVHNKKQYRRIVSSPQLDAGIHQKVWGYPYESHSMPDMGDLAEKSPRGLTVVRSQNHEKELCSVLGRKRM